MKHYLNKSLKSDHTGEVEVYPVYVLLTVQRKPYRFKSQIFREKLSDSVLNKCMDESFPGYSLRLKDEEIVSVCRDRSMVEGKFDFPIFQYYYKLYSSSLIEQVHRLGRQLEASAFKTKLKEGNAGLWDMVETHAKADDEIDETKEGFQDLVLTGTQVVIRKSETLINAYIQAKKEEDSLFGLALYWDWIDGPLREDYKRFVEEKAHSDRAKFSIAVCDYAAKTLE